MPKKFYFYLLILTLAFNLLFSPVSSMCTDEECKNTNKNNNNNVNNNNETLSSSLGVVKYMSLAEKFKLLIKTATNHIKMENQGKHKISVDEFVSEADIQRCNYLIRKTFGISASVESFRNLYLLSSNLTPSKYQGMAWNDLNLFRMSFPIHQVAILAAICGAGTPKGYLPLCDTHKSTIMTNFNGKEIPIYTLLYKFFKHTAAIQKDLKMKASIEQLKLNMSLWNMRIQNEIKLLFDKISQNKKN